MAAVTVDTTYLRAYLGTTSVTEAQLEGALEAERAAQAAVCQVVLDEDGAMPADLAQALCRRVARNLAMRGVPLAVQVGDLGPVPLKALDPEVQRLEAPYRQLVFGGSPPASHRRTDGMSSVLPGLMP